MFLSIDVKIEVNPRHEDAGHYGEGYSQVGGGGSTRPLPRDGGAEELRGDPTVYSQVRPVSCSTSSSGRQRIKKNSFCADQMNICLRSNFCWNSFLSYQLAQAVIKIISQLSTTMPCHCQFGQVLGNTFSNGNFEFHLMLTTYLSFAGATQQGQSKVKC